MTSGRTHRVLPGFAPALSVATLVVGLVVVLPLAALVLKAASMSWAEFVATVTAPRALAAYRLSFAAASAAALLNAGLGLLLAWVLARYRFPGRALLDAFVDLPFALPTAVAGLTLTALYAPDGWIGRLLAPAGLKVAFAPAGVVLALAFVSLPFVVRAVQPVLEHLDPELEEAAGVLGASRLQTFARIVFPNVLPPLLTGFTLAFARALGEYGSSVFISGNRPGRTEIAPLLVVTKLEQYDVAGATAIATVLLLASFALIAAVNALQGWTRRRAGASAMGASRHFRRAPALEERPAVRWSLTLAAAGLVGLFVLVPLASVFAQALRKGPAAYLAAIAEPNALAAIRLTRLAWPQMKERRWGRIINVLNIGAKAPRGGSAPTSITRAAGMALTKVLSHEGAPHNVLVNAMLVGFIEADQHVQAAKRAGVALEDYMAARAKDIPLGRIGRAEEFANMACFLVSDLGSYITGTAINIDGGRSPVV